MGRTLGFYIIREMTIPTVLSLLTITIVLLIKLIFDSLNLLFMAGIDFQTILKILADFAPSIVTFALPMALLMGIIIGVSRLTMDNEIIAIRSHGIHLFRLFIPAMVFTALLCVVMYYVSGTVAPRMMRSGVQKIVELQISLINALKPGEFHDEILGDDDEMVFFYQSRDETTERMNGLFLKFERPHEPNWVQEFLATARDVDVRRRSGEIVLRKPLREFYPDLPLEPAYRTTLTSSGIMRREPLEVNNAPAPPNIDYLPSVRDDMTEGELWQYSYPNAELLMVFAESGEIRSRVVDRESDGESEIMIELALYNGSIHHLSMDSESPDYLLVNFDEGQKRLFQNTTLDTIYKTHTNRNLRDLIDAPETESKTRRYARRELGERIAISPAMFVFMMFAVPLAIRLRPTGRSWGIMLAIGLMLVYYLMMKSGVSIYEHGHAYGLLIALLPNVLFLALGVGLWWRALRG